MASKIKKTVGVMKCWNPHCGCEVPVKEAENGTLDLACKYCDLPLYAKVGTQANADAWKDIRPINGAEPAPQPKQEPTPAPAQKQEPKPAPKMADAPVSKRNTLFG